MPNDLGIFDMHGNVAEWCQDSLRLYQKSSTSYVDVGNKESLVIQADKLRAQRGRGFLWSAEAVRSAARDGSDAGEQHVAVGFRVARTYPEADASSAAPPIAVIDRPAPPPVVRRAETSTR
jgi:formylglycine-generating enzyme required for sulfatase activity